MQNTPIPKEFQFYLFAKNRTAASSIESTLYEGSPFMKACFEGDIKTLQECLDGKHEITQKDYQDGIECAAGAGQTEALRFILDEGLYVEKTETNHNTVENAFAEAVFTGHADTARVLLEEDKNLPFLTRDYVEAILSEYYSSVAPNVYSVYKELAPEMLSGLIRAQDMEAMGAGLPKHKLLQAIGLGDEELGGSRWGETLNVEPPLLLRSESPYGFSLKAYEKLFPYLLQKGKEEGNSPHAACAQAHKLSVLFSKEELARKYLDTWAKPFNLDKLDQKERWDLLLNDNDEEYTMLRHKQPVHDACLFEIPKKGLWTIPAWRDLTMKHGPEMAKLIKAAPGIEKVLGRPPKSLNEARTVAGQFMFERGAENPTLAQVCNDLKLPEDQFNECLDFLKKNAKTKDNMPDIYVDGAEFGKPNYYFTKIDAADPRGLLMGEYTNCCQSLGGYGDAEARFGSSASDGGFYVVMQKQKDGVPPKIVAQTFGWIKDDVLVFDSWERLSDSYDSLCKPFLSRAAEQLLEKGFYKVNLGKGGNTPEGLSFATDRNPPNAPVGFTGRLDDSRKQYTILSR